MIKKFDEFINENIVGIIDKQSKGGAVRKENYVEQVDLGLPSGTIWAACNLGAESPEEYGDYYAWGETEPNSGYYTGDYKFGAGNKLTKYNGKDGKTILDPEDDAAHVVLGGKWHMPTKEQIQELLDNTTNKESELNGVKGILYTSKTNGNTLFFPYSGHASTDNIWGEGEFNQCWSSSLYTLYKGYAYTLFSKFNDSKFYKYKRHIGCSVRGVLDKK